jgi:hypothetical protein
VDVDQSVPVASRLIGRYGKGQIASMSFEKGSTRKEDPELLEWFIAQVIMPKRGRKKESVGAGAPGGGGKRQRTGPRKVGGG